LSACRSCRRNQGHLAVPIDGFETVSAPAADHGRGRRDDHFDAGASPVEGIEVLQISLPALDPEFLEVTEAR
jgi:hypothetical protein